MAGAAGVLCVPACVRVHARPHVCAECFLSHLKESGTLLKSFKQRSGVIRRVF